MSEKIKGDAAAQRYSRDSLQGIPDVGQGLLDAQSNQDDAGYHRQVQVAVGVSRKPRPLLPLRCGEPTPGDQHNEVEVGPPEGGGERDPEHAGDHDPYPDRQPRGPDTERHDRLAEGYDHYEAVALHEMLRVNPEARHTAD